MSAMHPPAPLPKQSGSVAEPICSLNQPGTFHLPQLTAVLTAVWKFKVHPPEPNPAENTTGLSLLNSGCFESGHKSSGASMLFFVAIFFFPVLHCNVLTDPKCCIECRYLSPQNWCFSWTSCLSFYTVIFRSKQFTYK